MPPKRTSSASKRRGTQKAANTSKANKRSKSVTPIDTTSISTNTSAAITSKATVASTTTNTTTHPPQLTGPLPTLIIDTGGWNIKHATLFPTQQQQHDNNTTNNNNTTSSSSADKKPSKSPNLIAKPKHQLTTLLSSQIDTVQNKSQLTITRPMERGYTTDLATQTQIWDHVVQEIEGLDPIHSFSNGGAAGVLPTLVTTNNAKKSKSKGKVGNKAAVKSDDDTTNAQKTFTHTAAVFCLTQPWTPRSILEREDMVWFRDLGFGRVARRLGASCSAYKYLQEGKQNTAHSTISSTSTNTSTSYSTIPARFHVPDDNTGCCCIIDSGFSMTSIIPTINTMAIQTGIRRIHVGGKLLTNLLKQILSYRKFNMMDEFYIVNEAKELLLFLSMDFEQEMKDARDVRVGGRWFDREFVLPDFIETFRGSVRLPALLQHLNSLALEEKKEHVAIVRVGKDVKGVKGVKGVKDVSVNIDGNATTTTNNEKTSDSINNTDTQDNENKPDEKTGAEDEKDDPDDSNSDDETEDQAKQRILKQRQEERNRQEQEEMERQALPFSVERFAIPEVLFRPADIGIQQLGIAEAIVQSIEACDAIYRPALYQNIVLTGGNVNIVHMKERLEKELRSLAPANVTVRVYLPKEPDVYAWEGARELVHDNELKGSNIYLDRTEWEAKVESGHAAGDIWASVLNKDGPSGLTFI